MIEPRTFICPECGRDNRPDLERCECGCVLVELCPHGLSDERICLRCWYQAHPLESSFRTRRPLKGRMVMSRIETLCEEAFQRLAAIRLEAQEEARHPMPKLASEIETMLLDWQAAEDEATAFNRAMKADGIPYDGDSPQSIEFRKRWHVYVERMTNARERLIAVAREMRSNNAAQ